MEKRLTPEEQEAKEEIKKLKKEISKAIGKRIKYYRDEMKYSQENLVGDINNDGIIMEKYNDIHKNDPKIGRTICETKYSVNSLWRHEHGDMEMGIITFINICRALHVTPNELLADFFQDDEASMPEITQMYKRLDVENQRALLEYYDLLYYKQSGGGQYGKF